MTNKFDLVNKTIFKIFNSTCYKFNLVNVHFNNVVNYFNIQCVLLVYLQCRLAYCPETLAFALSLCVINFYLCK